MGKFIEKKIKRSVPVIVIFCLINVFVLGFSFNLNFNFVQPKVNGFVKMASNAWADTASTTVIVKNAPPHFTAGPSENPTSTSTTPVNVGGSIGFTGTATDDEGDSYWMIVCSGNEATTTTDGLIPPTCVASTEFCLSNKASSTDAVSCTYNNVTDPGSEMRIWYAFVCDNHYGQPVCSPLGQGTGNGGSPFYVNHAPVLTSVQTNVDNQNPGSPFTLTASTTDSDVTGGIDNMNIYVCDTNGWNLNGGCTGTELCHGSSTINTSVSCNYSTAIPRMHGAYTYYGFVSDWHKMAASSGNGTSATYNVNNVAPVVSNVTLHNGVNITLNIRGAPQIVTMASSSSVTDNNGCTDLSTATSSIYLSSVANGANCSADDNNCYLIPAANCHLSNCSGPSSATATFSCTTSLAFYTMPTDASSIASTSSWFTKIKVADALGLHGSGTYSVLDGVEVISTAALDVQQLSIAYGSVQAGTNTGATNASTTVVNYGNTPIDTAVSGVDMLRNSTGPEYIGIENQQHSINTFSFTAGNTSSTTPDTVQTNIARPNSLTDVTNDIFWGISVPAGTPSASFFGYNTFTVILDESSNWQYP